MTELIAALLQLVKEYPFGMFFLASVTLFMTERILALPWRIVNRWIRHRNIIAKGWPPEHLDADGDFKSAENNS